MGNANSKGLKVEEGYVVLLNLNTHRHSQGYVAMIKTNEFETVVILTMVLR